MGAPRGRGTTTPLSRRRVQRAAGARPPVTTGGQQLVQRRLRLPRTSHRRRLLVGFDNARDDWRLFRVDRITEPWQTGARTAPRGLPDGDAAAYVRRKLSSLTGPSYRAVVTLHAPASQVPAKLGPLADQLEPLDDQRCWRHSHADSLSWLGIRLAMLGCEFEVHEPPEPATFLRELGARITRGSGG